MKSLAYIDNRKIVFWLISAAIVLVCFLYAYFAGLAMIKTIEAKRDTKAAQEIQQKFQILEGQYFSLVQKINLDYAYSKGFVDKSGEEKYVSKTSSVAKR